MDMNRRVKRRELEQEIGLLRVELADERDLVQTYAMRVRELEVLLRDAEARAKACESEVNVQQRIVREVKEMLAQQQAREVRLSGELGQLRVQKRGRDERIGELEREVRALKAARSWGAEGGEAVRLLQRVVQADKDDARMGHPNAGDSCVGICLSLEVVPWLEQHGA